ncbi:MAG: hypothetical protein OXU77_20400 [Gammaproteobacteria bacterium]|nr:hypothetical protein [Gammaproteobacteria bacterium]
MATSTSENLRENPSAGAKAFSYDRVAEYVDQPSGGQRWIVGERQQVRRGGNRIVARHLASQTG